MKYYTSIQNLGLTIEDVVDITSIVKTLPVNSSLEFSTGEANKQEYYTKGVIPEPKCGIIRIVNLGRVYMTYHTDDNSFYTRTAHNYTIEADSYNKWKSYSGSEIS